MAGSEIKEPTDVELATTIEDYYDWDEDAEAHRLQWSIGENDMKPKLLNGRRVAAGGELGS